MATRRRKKDSSPEITDQDVQAAVNIIDRDYRQDVRSYAEEIYRQIQDGEIESDSDVREAIERECDDCRRVIMTFQAKLGMLVTDHADAWEDMGLEHPTIEQQMYCALVEDVSEELERLKD